MGVPITGGSDTAVARIFVVTDSPPSGLPLDADVIRSRSAYRPLSPETSQVRAAADVESSTTSTDGVPRTAPPRVTGGA